MSHANTLVRFDDGTILFGEYNGTADIQRPLLYRTYEEMHANWRRDIGHLAWQGCAHQEPATIATDYGSGSTWRGTACRQCLLIGPPHNTMDFEVADGLPEWFFSTPEQRAFHVKCFGESGVLPSDAFIPLAEIQIRP